VIGLEDFGVAAAFAMTFSLLEMMSNLASDKLLIQASDGDERGLQSTAQLLLWSRGLGSGAILFALAGPLSRLFGVPQAEWGFRCLALLPVARGFAHLDMNRMQRHMRFGPVVYVDVGSNLLVTALAFPFALWFRDYSAMLWLLVMQSVAWSIGSHMVAERRYSMGWDRHYAKRLFTFGWPLLINGLLLYGIMEGDRVIIGSAKQLFGSTSFTLADLGVYSVAFSLTMAPTMFVANLATSLFLPVLSRAKKSPGEFQCQYLRGLHSVCLAATTISIPFIFTRGHLVTWVYGGKYAAAAGIIGWLAAMWGVRIIRAIPTIAAIANGDTKLAMISNAFRSLALGGIICAAANGTDLVWIAVSGLAGEILALVVSVWRLDRLHEVPAEACLRPLAVIGFGMLMSSVVSLAPFEKLGPIGLTLGALTMTVLTISALIATIPQLRSDTRRLTASIVEVLRAKALSAEV